MHDLITQVMTSAVALTFYASSLLDHLMESAKSKLQIVAIGYCPTGSSYYFSKN